MMSSVENRLTHQEAALDGVVKQISELTRSVHQITQSLGQIGAATAKFEAFVHEARANKPASTIDSMRTWLSMAQSVGVIAAMIVAGIVYVASNANSADAAVNKYRIEQIERHFAPQK
jgi:uncharacterized coiled-coil protein SlyX